MRILQITDTHLSPIKTHFNGNWAPLLAWIEQQQLDLIVHTGDLAVDGADLDEDLAFCRDLFNALPARSRFVPGNHDIGHMKDSVQPINGARLARWHQHFGPDYWSFAGEDWHIIGLNSLLFGTGLDEEEAQFIWLEGELAAANGKPVAIFAHKPLFIAHADEGKTGYWGIEPEPRQRLLQLFDLHNVRLHASGHLHRAYSQQHAGITYIWTPAAGFIGGKGEAALPGQNILGAVLHELGEELYSEIVELRELTPFVIDDVIDEVYPKHTLPADLQPDREDVAP